MTAVVIDLLAFACPVHTWIVETTIDIGRNDISPIVAWIDRSCVVEMSTRERTIVLNIRGVHYVGIGVGVRCMTDGYFIVVIVIIIMGKGRGRVYRKKMR